MTYGYSKKQKAFFDENAEEWDVMTIHDTSKVEYISNLLRIRKGEKILDVGTGTGIMIPFYQGRIGDGTITAVDYSVNMLSVARSKYPESKHSNIEYRVCDVHDLDYDEVYDLVVSYSCFPHFKDKKRAINRFFKAVKPGGRVAIAHSSSADHINGIHKEVGGNISEDILPTMRELTCLMEDEGFRTTYTQDDDEYYIYIAEKSC